MLRRALAFCLILLLAGLPVGSAWHWASAHAGAPAQAGAIAKAAGTSEAACAECLAYAACSQTLLDSAPPAAVLGSRPDAPRCVVGRSADRQAPIPLSRGPPLSLSV